jgi:predicted ATPase
MARLDRLGPAAKEIAQIGAVLGREFAYELIEPVAQRREKELQAGLNQLADAGLLSCRGAAPHASYLFKHALVQDAAYSTLLRGRRQELHARIAAALEVHFSDLVQRQPELLAHHLTAAGDAERAVDQWLKAGQHAATLSAHHEGIRHFERGLATLAALPEGPARDGQEIELQLARGLSLLTAEGFASPGAAKPIPAPANSPSDGAIRASCSFRFTAFGSRPPAPEGSSTAADCRTGCSNLPRARRTTNCVCRRITAPGQLV